MTANCPPHVRLAERGKGEALLRLRWSGTCSRRPVAPGEAVHCRWRALSDEHDAPPHPFGAPRHHPAHAQIPTSDSATKPLRALGSGWACVSRTLADGRRQIQHLLVPGDLLVLHGEAIPGSHLFAITPVTVVQSERLDGAAWTSPAIRRSLAAIHQQLLNQIVRLGRQHANERVAHLFMELRDRLLLAGVGEERRFEMPLTQEQIGDTLGLTAVHVNRMLRTLEDRGLIARARGRLTVRDPAALSWLAGLPHRALRTDLGWLPPPG